jgi:hypothetical protein
MTIYIKKRVWQPIFQQHYRGRWASSSAETKPSAIYPRKEIVKFEYNSNLVRGRRGGRKKQKHFYALSN